MAEYIEREAFKKDLIHLGFFPALVARVLENQPTSDVVPREEVEKIFAFIEKQETSDEYGKYYLITPEEFAELKKKYTEDWDG